MCSCCVPFPVFVCSCCEQKNTGPVCFSQTSARNIFSQTHTHREEYT
jgi:hypothetical protein